MSGKNILMVIAPDKFRDEELNHPRQVFKQAGESVTVASTRKGEAVGMLGHREKVDYDLNDVAGKTFDAVVVVGGAGAQTSLWGVSALHDILRRHHQMGKVVAAICLSGAVLAKAGLLKGIPATVWKSDESLSVYTEHGVNFQDKPVVRSGKIVTAQGPFAAREFGQEVVSALEED